MKVAVITVSDRASAGVYSDRSGPEIEGILSAALPGIELRRCLVADEVPAIVAALDSSADCDWILTTGGTGIGPRDVTPEATRQFIEREIPGMAEALRAASLVETPFAMFSRGIAGQRGQCLVVNFPGSVKAVRLCTRTLLPLLEHGPLMARGEGH